MAESTATPATSTSEKVTKELPSQIFVTRTFKAGDAKENTVSSEPQVIQVHRFQTEPARAEIHLGLTLNLGNFESARVDVGVVIPCYREELEDAFAFGKAWAEKKLLAEVDDVRKNASSNKSPF